MTNNDYPIISKVLILDDGMAEALILKNFCEECGLIGIKPQQAGRDAVMAILRSNVDLGGILLYENYGDASKSSAHINGIHLAREIHRLRPELPLFLRRDRVAHVTGLSESDAAMFRCAYVSNDLQSLRTTLDASIFNRIYPNALVRGISEMTQVSLENLFPHCEVSVETPYVVKDRIIYGEVFTIIAIESSWCRGYMMLQAEEANMLNLISQNPNNHLSGEATFRDLNNILGEATNLIWGSFKNRYIGPDDASSNPMQSQVPLIINHHQRFISFGSEDPQLCLKYNLHERHSGMVVPIFQRFVFNLNWSPEAFKENPTVESLVSTGELELF